MQEESTSITAINDRTIKVWVLAPSIESTDENIDYYYDFTQSIAEYTKVFEELKMPWTWQPVNMGTYRAIIEQIDTEMKQGEMFPVVLNLCDGDEVNGTPGVSVVKLLEEKQLVYTGADEHFYTITTSKIPMKKAFDTAGVRNASWESIHTKDIDRAHLLNRLGTPLIIKPAVSGGSMGVGIKNVVHNEEELETLLQELFDGYRGWNLAADGMIAERFITGAEYTVFISGSYDRPDEAVLYMPVERVFHESLPETEKFLSFDRLWEIYENESAMPNGDSFYEYKRPDEALIEAIQQLSWDAYCATKGKGYTRVDIRMDANTKELYVLEVNAQCGISEDENYTSIGAILKASGKSFTQLVEEIITDALKRAAIKKLSYLNKSIDARA